MSEQGKDFTNHLDQGSHTQIPSVPARSRITKGLGPAGDSVSCMKEGLLLSSSHCCHRPGTARGSECLKEAGKSDSGEGGRRKQNTPARQIWSKCCRVSHLEPDRAGQASDPWRSHSYHANLMVGRGLGSPAVHRLNKEYDLYKNYFSSNVKGYCDIKTKFSFQTLLN